MTIQSDQRVFSIGEVIRNAIVFDAKRSPEDAMSADALLGAVAQLFSLLTERKVDYALAGGIALLQYVEGRNTEDIDILMAVTSLNRLPEIRIESRDANFARGKFKGLQVDILLTRNALFAEVQQQHITMRRFVERDIPCVTVEGLLVLKLYALPSLYRQGNFARIGIYENDIATLLQAYQPPLEPILATVSKFVTDTDLASLQDVLSDIQKRIARFGRRGTGTLE